MWTKLKVGRILRYGNNRARNSHELWDLVVEIWDNLAQDHDYCLTLVDSILRRCQSIDAGGMWTRYYFDLGTPRELSLNAHGAVHGVVILLENKFLLWFQSRTEWSITFSKICTYWGALNRPWMRSSTSTPVRDIQPQQWYAKLPRSLTSLDIACVISGAWLTINVSTWFTIGRDGCFVGENYVSPIKIPPTSCKS